MWSLVLRWRGGECGVSNQQVDLGLVWAEVVQELATSHLSPQQRAWMRVTRPIGLLDGTALLAAPSDFAKDAIERALRDPITDALSRRLGRVVSLAVKVDPMGSQSTPPSAPVVVPPVPQPPQQHPHPAAPPPPMPMPPQPRPGTPRPGVGSFVEQTLVMAPIKVDTGGSEQPPNGADNSALDNTDNDEVDEVGDALATVHE